MIHSFEVEGAPPPEPGFEFRYFVDKQDVQERERASRVAFTARDTHERIVRSLCNEAETRLAELSSGQRYAVLCEMFGFPNVDTSKAFVARRRPPAVVADAVRVVGRLAHLSQYLGRAEELSQAREAMEKATVTVKRLGSPPVRAFSKRAVYSWDAMSGLTN